MGWVGCVSFWQIVAFVCTSDQPSPIHDATLQARKLDREGDLDPKTKIYSK